jgi:xylulokinase
MSDAAATETTTATELRHVEQGPADSTYVLAVDLGTGGPKAAVLSATGRVAAHAFEAVGIHLTEDGGAEQSPQE